MTLTDQKLRTAVLGGEPHDWEVIEHYMEEISLSPLGSSCCEFPIEFLPRTQRDEWVQQLDHARHHDLPYDLAIVDAETSLLPVLDVVSDFIRSNPHAHAIVMSDVGSSIAVQIADRFGQSQRVVLTRKPLDDTEFRMLANMVLGKIFEERQGDISQRYTTKHLPLSTVDTTTTHEQLVEEHNHLCVYTDQLIERLEDTRLELVNSRDVTVLALAQLADSRDPETGEHLLRMRAFAQVLGCYLCKELRHPVVDDDYLAELYRSTPLHDIGKVGIPDNILLKPGKLTDDEFEIMKQHTVIGAKTLERATRHYRNSNFLDMAVEIALYHHERFNGSGYPCGLRGEEIPLSARITALADVFDALTSARVYKSAMSLEKARDLIVAERGEHFDPLIVDVFGHCLQDFFEVKRAIDNGDHGVFEASYGNRMDIDSIVGAVNG